MSDAEFRERLARMEQQILGIPDRVSLVVIAAVKEHEERKHGKNGNGNGNGNGRTNWIELAKGIGVPIVSAVLAAASVLLASAAL